jgi:hypothetical protein
VRVADRLPRLQLSMEAAGELSVGRCLSLVFARATPITLSATIVADVEGDEDQKLRCSRPILVARLKRRRNSSNQRPVALAALCAAWSPTLLPPPRLHRCSADGVGPHPRSFVPTCLPPIRLCLPVCLSVSLSLAVSLHL